MMRTNKARDEAAEKLGQMWGIGYAQGVKENDRLHQHIDDLVDILSSVINLTFEGNEVFDTVVFQKRNMPPLIFKNGQRLDTEKAENVNISCKKESNGYSTNVKIDIGD